MESGKQNWRLIALAGAATSLVVGSTILLSQRSQKQDAPQEEQNVLENQLQNNLKRQLSDTGYHNILIGDVGGTNVRLQLIRIYNNNIDKKDILKELTKYKTQESSSFIENLHKFLADVPQEHYPSVGVVGIAGAVTDNKVQPVNCPWPLSDGNEIAKICGFKSFLFINDFLAAGYGVSRLKPSDCTKLNPSDKAVIKENGLSVKAVIGPGTGLGQAFLAKSGGDLYDTFPAEGGHVDFSVKNKEDWELAEFARNYIETSNNIENQKCKRKVDRLSVESLCAGPAIPLIYQFYKQRYPELEAILEKDSQYGNAIPFDQIQSKDIIDMAIKYNDKLCMKVVEKFTENLGTETGNLALKTLPYGGIYLIGGVTDGIQQYLKTNKKFIQSFCNKGRCSELVEQFQILLVDSQIEIGLLGAEERARREFL